MYVNPLKAQVNGNYAPNPGFNNKILCPKKITNVSLIGGTNFLQLDVNGNYQNVVSDWRDVGEGIFGGGAYGSTYFNECNTIPCEVGIGTNELGFQNDHTNATTDGYVAIRGNTGYPIIIYPPLTTLDSILIPVLKNGTRSYITAELLAPLTIGKTYEVVFYVSLPEYSALAVNNLGAVFTNDRLPKGSFNRNSPKIDVGLLNVPHDYFLSELIVTDRQNWIKISGSITATDNFDWITIGVFDDSYATNNIFVPAYTYVESTATCNPPPTTGYNGFLDFAYYIDDVGIYEQPNPAFTYNTIGAVCDLVEFNAIATFNQPWYNHTWKLLSGINLIDTKPTGNNPTVTFTGIPAGTYTLVHEITGYGATYTSQQTITISGYNHATYTANTGFETWTANNNPLNGNSGITATIKDVLLIPSNSHIIVEDMEILFGPNAKLVIEQGASFTANNSTFSVNEECEAIMWDGIQVYGTTTLPQGAKPTDPNQGNLELRNCTLRHAYTGVLVGKPGSGCSGGGVIKIIGSTFENNRVHVKMKDYSGRDNKSYLLRSDFITTDYLRDGSGIAVKNYVELNDMQSVKIKNSNFETVNFDPQNYNISRNGNGIVAINSSIAVVPNNHFTNLNTAIRLIKTGIAQNFCQIYNPQRTNTIAPTFYPSSQIRGTTIEECFRGIWASNTLGDYYDGNNINVTGEISENRERSIGILVEASSPILITRNTFTEQTANGFGIVVKNGGTFGTTVEENIFNQVGVSLLHEYNNKLASINCNEFNSNSNKNWVVSLDRYKIEPYLSGVFFPANVGQCRPGGLSGNQFLNGCVSGSERQVNSYSVFDYAVPFNSIGTDPDQICVSSIVTIDRCTPVSTSTTICNEVTNDPTEIDNQLRNTTDPQVRNYLLGKLLSVYLSDTNSRYLQSAQELISYENTVEADKIIAQTHLFDGDLIDYRNKLNSIHPNDLEDSIFLAFHSGLVSKLSAGFTIDSLGEFVATLETWAEQNYTVSDLARSILEVFYNRTYPHNPFEINEGGNRIAQSLNEKVEQQLYPNPADDLLTLSYDLQAGDKILVFSNLGSKISTINVTTESNSFELKTENFQSGIYFLVVQKQNGENKNFKFSVVH